MLRGSLKSKKSRACEFSQAERTAIFNRDGGCIFCNMGYMPSEYAGTYMGYAHYIPRSDNGLGIRENGVLMCQYHHNMMDNGNKGNRREMLDIVKGYLQEHYKDWDEENLRYNKWSALAIK